MSDVDLGGPTLVLNDKDYQYLRNHTEQKILYPNTVLILSIKRYAGITKCC